MKETNSISSNVKVPSTTGSEIARWEDTIPRFLLCSPQPPMLPKSLLMSLPNENVAIPRLRRRSPNALGHHHLTPRVMLPKPREVTLASLGILVYLALLAVLLVAQVAQGLLVTLVSLVPQFKPRRVPKVVH